MRENTFKATTNENSWVFELAQRAELAEPVEVAARYSGEDIVADIKEVLKSRGSMMIRGLGRVFRILDDNRNRQLDANEIKWGLKDFGIFLDDEQVSALITKFDRDNSKTVNFDEFLRALRGDLNESRLGWIKKAYDKLDVNKDGKVTLDDVARLYDVSHHPDVKDGKMSPEDAYRQFMSMWDT